MWSAFGTNRAKGVSILFSRNLDYEIHNVITDELGRYIILYCTIQRRKILLANVYAPNTDDSSFFVEFFKEVARFNPDYTMIGGDFNLVLDLDIDKQGGRYFTHTKAAEVVKANMESLHLVDVWREVNREKSEFTWRKLRPEPIFVRLDLFLVMDTLLQLVDNSEILPGIKTDHS